MPNTHIFSVAHQRWVVWQRVEDLIKKNIAAFGIADTYGYLENLHKHFSCLR